MMLQNTDYEEFQRLCSGKKLYCYGAGKMLGEMFQDMGQVCTEIEIVDSDPSSWGSVRSYGKSNFIVRPPEILKNVDQRSLVLITSGALQEILDNISKLLPESTQVFAFPAMRAYTTDKRLITIGETTPILGKCGEPQIPRVIHYCWFGGKPMPDSFKKNVDTWGKICPAFEIKEWNETNCDISETDYTKQAYAAGKFGFVPDYFRLKIICEHGGIYLDTDVRLLKPLDELLYLKAYASFEDNHSVALGLGFGAIPHHPIVQDMLDEYKNISFLNSDGTLNLTPSPKYQTSALKRWGLNCNGKMQAVNDMTILPMDYLCAKSWRTGLEYITDNTISIHDYAASWFFPKELQQKLFIRKLIHDTQ